MLSPTIRACASSDQWRRRSGPFKTSIRRGLSIEEPSLATSITSSLASKTTNLPHMVSKNDVPPCHRLHWLCDVANEMDQEDGLIWVYGPGDDGVMAFTDDGIENLRDLVQIHKDDP